MTELLITTKIFNSYLLMFASKSKGQDSPVLKAFKDMIRQLKDLSFVNERCIHLEAQISGSKERYLVVKNLESSLVKLKEMKAKLDKTVFACFEAFQKYLMHEVNNSIKSNQEVFSFTLHWLLNLLHDQLSHAGRLNKEEQKESVKSLRSPYSEISKMAQMSFEVNYETSNGNATIGFDIPFILTLNANSVSLK